jgi:hypothetical protein
MNGDSQTLRQKTINDDEGSLDLLKGWCSDDSPRLLAGGFWNDSAVSSHSLTCIC